MITLLDDGEANTLLLGQRDERLVLVTQDEDVGGEGRPDVATRVTDLDDFVLTHLRVARNDDAHTANVATASGHAQVANIEVDEGRELASGDVDLDDVVDLDIRVRIADDTTIVSREVRDTSREQADTLDLAQLEGGLLGEDSVEDEASLGVVEETEVLISTINVHDVHETGGEGAIRAHLAVNSDQTLHEDEGHLTLGQGVLEAVAQQDHQGQALTQLVGTGVGTSGLIHPKFAYHQSNHDSPNISIPQTHKQSTGARTKSASETFLLKSTTNSRSLGTVLHTKTPPILANIQ